MEMRVEQLSAQADVSVDTVRYYQSKGLLDPPRREGRIAWYGDAHVERLHRIRSLQQQGFTLATIARLVSGDLDAADEALIGQLSGLHVASDLLSGGRAQDLPSENAARTTDTRDGSSGGGTHRSDPTRTYSLDELGMATGMPLALLKAIEAEGLLVPTRVAGQERYTDEDVAAARAGLRMLEWGIPLTDLLDLARRHNQATQQVALDAVELFAQHVRRPLRHGAVPDALADTPDSDGDPAVNGLLLAYAELLPAVNTLVGHHFIRTLVKVALDYVERDGTDAERDAVWNRTAPATQERLPATPDLPDTTPAGARA
ncbi:MAG: MerR family transcriptional regulator [Acidimicrobiales bacterium]